MSARGARRIKMFDAIGDRDGLSDEPLGVEIKALREQCALSREHEIPGIDPLHDGMQRGDAARRPVVAGNGQLPRSVLKTCDENEPLAVREKPRPGDARFASRAIALHNRDRGAARERHPVDGIAFDRGVHDLVSRAPRSVLSNAGGHAPDPPL